MWTRIRTTWRAVTQRHSWERDLDEELRLHAELRAQDLMRTGLTLAEAHRRARLELGSRETHKEEARAAFGLRWFDEAGQDLRYAVRVLRRTPGFTAVAALSLALGIGANMVVFSVANALFLRPLPVSEPDRLYFLQGSRGIGQSYPNYRDLRDRNITFSSLFAYRIIETGMGLETGAERVWGYEASGNYFDALGVQPALGRFFHAQDDRQPGASPYAVLSYECWRNRFQGDPRIVGRTVRLNLRPYTILGVAPRGFRGTEVFYTPEIWVPVSMQEQFDSFPFLDNRGGGVLWVSGRVKSGVTRAQAEANLNAIAAALAKEYPQTNEGWSLHLSQPGLLGDAGRKPIGAFVGGVLILAGLVLLAGCANLAALFSARASDRRQEMAVRVSIGAGRLRILRQWLVEALLLALLGGGCGLGLAALLLSLLKGWRLPVDFPIPLEVAPDGRVLLFVVLASIGTGLLFGLAPARQIRDLHPNQGLKGTTDRRRKMPGREWALVAQVVVCCVVVMASIVSLRGLSKAFTTPAGIEPNNGSAAAFDLALSHYTPRQGNELRQRVLDEIARLPGVTAAGYTHSLPLSLDQSSTGVFAEQASDFRPSQARMALFYAISPGYFRAAGTRLLAGRDFTWSDRLGAPRVAIVNETLARQIVGTPNAVGRRFRDGPGANGSIEIVGVVEDGKYESLAEEPRAVVFWASRQFYISSTTVIARSARPDPALAERMRATIAKLDPALPVFGVGRLKESIGAAYMPAEAATVALTAFGVLALMLALTGVYGLASYAVSRRVREIGVRVALGADRGQVLRSVLGRMAWLVGAGLMMGIAAGPAASRLLANIVYQATPRDPLVLGGVLLTMVPAALAAGLGPARRALSLDPWRILRHE